MIGKSTPTGMKPATPDRDALQQADDRAWKRYEAVCWDPVASGLDRSSAFKEALTTSEALLEFDKKLRQDG